MNDAEIEKNLRTKIRALKFRIREERMRLNAIEREKRQGKRIMELLSSEESLLAEASLLGINGK